jgi:hypothetical protein
MMSNVADDGADDAKVLSYKLALYNQNDEVKVRRTH